MRRVKASSSNRFFGAHGDASKTDSFLRSPPPVHSTSIYKIDERQHFHYDNVELGPVTIALVTPESELTSNSNFDVSTFYWTFTVESNGEKWTIRRNFTEFSEFDGQLHRCVFDRRFSRLVELRLLCFNHGKQLTIVNSLPKLSTEGKDESPSPTSSSNSSNVTTTTAALSWAISSPIKIRCILSHYVERLSQLTGSIIKCFPVLKFLELDSRGNRFVPIEQLHINIPAVAAAIVIRSFESTKPEELSIKIGDFISIIEMPTAEQSDDNYWKGKLTITNNKAMVSSSRASLSTDPFVGGHLFAIGYFPSSCVKLFTGKMELDGYYSSSTTRIQRRSFIKRQKEMWKLPSSPQLMFWKKKQKKEPEMAIVFGTDLSEYVARDGSESPLILKKCAEVIETHGLVTGIYRQCGIQSNIQRLKWEFDTGQPPDFEDPKILRDIHCVSSLLKQYFRQLPNPLFTYELYADFMRAYQNNPKSRIENIRQVVQKLPPAHYKTAQALMNHLHKMCQFKNLTDMNSNNLAIVWAPNLFRIPPSEDNDGQLLRGISLHNKICNFFILNATRIFNDSSEENSVLEKSNSCMDPQTSQNCKDSSEEFLLPGNRTCVDVNGGPAFLPSGFHTVIERNNKKDAKWKNLLRHSSIKNSVTNFLNQRRRSSDTERSTPKKDPMTSSFTNSLTASGMRRCTSVISNITSNVENFGTNFARTFRTFSVRKFKRNKDENTASEDLAIDEFELVKLKKPDEAIPESENPEEKSRPEVKFEAGVVEIEVTKPKKVMFENSGIEEHFFYPVENSDDPDADKLSTDISSAESLPLDISRYDNVPTTNLFLS